MQIFSFVKFWEKGFFDEVWRTRRSWSCVFGVAARVAEFSHQISEPPAIFPPGQPRNAKSRPKPVPTIHEEGSWNSQCIQLPSPMVCISGNWFANTSGTQAIKLRLLGIWVAFRGLRCLQVISLACGRFIWRLFSKVCVTCLRATSLLTACLVSAIAPVGGNTSQRAFKGSVTLLCMLGLANAYIQAAPSWPRT